MKKMRAASTSVRKSFICLVSLPVVVVALTVTALLVFPAGAANQANQPVSYKSSDAEIQSVIDRVSLPIDAPEPESQETSKQIAEQKRLKEEEKIAQEAEKKRLEQERILALKKELEVKQARDEARNKICFIGDSITQGGVYGERGAADRTIDILNAGHPADDPPYDGINIARGGSTTGDWIGTISSDASHCRKSNLKVVMIMLGTNDAGKGIPTSEYLVNMATIRAVANGMGAAVVINCPILLGSADGKTLIEEYCAGLGANGVATPLDLPLSDSIHPTSGGYGMLAQRWADIIRGQVGI
jgi:lysophospholipase L1-like esterase